MYKILYLPLGKDVLIKKGLRLNCIRRKLTYSTLTPYLCAPTEDMNDYDDNETEADYKIALFRTKPAAESWLVELIHRNSCFDYNFRKEHFEIVKLE